MGGDSLALRVEQFKCLELPGQPQSMHMGTMYLVDELWRELTATRIRITELEAQIKVNLPTPASSEKSADESPLGG